MTTPLYVFGASGLLAGELMRLVEAHPEFELAGAITRSSAGTVCDLHPNLTQAAPLLKREEAADASRDPTAHYLLNDRTPKAPHTPFINKRNKPLSSRVKPANPSSEHCSGLPKDSIIGGFWSIKACVCPSVDRSDTAVSVTTVHGQEIALCEVCLGDLVNTLWDPAYCATKLQIS